MPVCKRTITQGADNKAKEEPGGPGEGKCYKICYPGFFPDPAEEVENDQGRMEHNKKNIQYPVNQENQSAGLQKELDNNEIDDH